MNLKTKDVKVFVPSKDFTTSLNFYTALGWKVNYRAKNDAIAELELADCRFYLQNYYQRGWANNFMLHITVEDAQAWYDHATAVIATKQAQKGTCPSATTARRTVHLSPLSGTPSGVLLHFAQPDPHTQSL